ncbi:ATP-dependent nuclease [Clostridium butyricum]
MYLRSFEINNFRKFGRTNNIVEFSNEIKQYSQRKSEKVNIAQTTTLIVGKNNSGKTSIIQALDKLIRENSFNSNDFNFFYLKELLSKYNSSSDTLEAPYMEFVLTVGIDNENTDLITNIISFMTLEDVDNAQIDIIIKYEIEDYETFTVEVKKILREKYNENILFAKFLELIDNLKFKINYYNKSRENIEKFRLIDLMDLTSIKANNISSEHGLCIAINKIVKYRYNNLLGNDKKDLEESINSINSTLTKKISNNHTTYINNSLGEIISKDKLKVLLSADLSFQKLMNDLVKYEYVEGKINVPENQFGLGYTNLMEIISEIIDYMEKYPENSFNSKINLISIEEPETFMHPQMQELFIKNINNAINTLLKDKNKNVNSQLIMTTHSSHILNSKIHSGNTFNNINCINTQNNCARVVALNDEKITPEGDDSEDDLKFIKNHIKYKVSELFFADAIILVEGATEDTILPYYIDKNEKLNKYYVSIFNINGAHGLVYRKLLKLLKVPTLIITDLDIKRDDDEKEKYTQINNLKDRVTTNQTIIKYNNGSDKLDHIPEYIKDENIIITYQGSIKRSFATSFEEAFILTNFDNDILNKVLNKIKPNIYKEIVGNKNTKNNIKESYKWQRKLSKSKSEFANELLYNLIIEDDKKKIPLLPKYIENGIKQLVNQLKEKN